MKQATHNISWLFFSLGTEFKEVLPDRFQSSPPSFSSSKNANFLLLWLPSIPSEWTNFYVINIVTKLQYVVTAILYVDAVD